MRNQASSSVNRYFGMKSNLFGRFYIFIRVLKCENKFVKTPIETLIKLWLKHAQQNHRKCWNGKRKACLQIQNVETNIILCTRQWFKSTQCGRTISFSFCLWPPFVFTILSEYFGFRYSVKTRNGSRTKLINVFR